VKNVLSKRKKWALAVAGAMKDKEGKPIKNW
jgi:hypothetical protein